jgi:predicted Zn-dependent peptidase
MIDYQRFELDNGLRVIVHEDVSSPLVAVNILYQVGSKDEDPEMTGFAHLFEHLMFGGSKNIADFDDPIQLAGGENNAFTNSDITNYYNTVPAQNIETILWLESDRMKQLDFSQRSLDVQKKVVLEEFKETCLNKPYGDVWHHLSSLAYKDHSYKWPTIGLVPRHIEEAELPDVERFFYNFYRPNNAILVLSGNITLARAKELSHKWFSDIPVGEVSRQSILVEAKQSEYRFKEVKNNVPLKSLYMGFHMPGRLDPDYAACDLLSDIFANGKSSRFYIRLCKERQLFSSVDAYITGSIDPGLFILEGKPMTDYSLEQAAGFLWEQVEEIKEQGVSERELQKLKNKLESSLAYSEVSILNKAMNLAYFENLGDADLINNQSVEYNRITVEDIQRVARKYLVKQNCSELRYLPVD